MNKKGKVTINLRRLSHTIFFHKICFKSGNTIKIDTENLVPLNKMTLIEFTKFYLRIKSKP